MSSSYSKGKRIALSNILNEKDLVDRIYINFCNPWPKPRHNKKRLTHTKQLEKYKIFLKSYSNFCIHAF